MKACSYGFFQDGKMIYEIADLRIRIENRCSFTTEFCKEYFSQIDGTFDLSAKVSKAAFAEEKHLSPGYSDGYIENICLYREICMQLPRFDRFLLHAAVLSFAGEGYAFLGRSGVGKSTHTGLWLKYLPETRIINGDKPVIGKKGSCFYAYGTPWNGKEGRGEKGSAVLKGLCFLEQAKENRLTRLTEKEAADRIFSQILIPSDEENAAKTLELVDGLISSTPAYLLCADVSEEAVKTSFEGLTGRKYLRKYSR